MIQSFLLITPFLLVTTALSQVPQTRYAIIAMQTPAGITHAAGGSVVVNLPRIVINLNNDRYLFVAYSAMDRSFTNDTLLAAFHWQGFLTGKSIAQEAAVLLAFEKNQIWLRINAKPQIHLILFLQDQRPDENFNNRFKLFEKQPSNTDKPQAAKVTNQNVDKNKVQNTPP